MQITRSGLSAMAATRGPEFERAILAASSASGDLLELPAAAWHQIQRAHPPAPRGLGDLIAVVAQPIARALDRALGTDIEHCGGCAKRRAALNALTRPTAPPPP